MSAYLCAEEDINALVNAVNGTEADFNMLVAENLRSLEARYPGRPFLADWQNDAKSYTFCKSAEFTSMPRLRDLCEEYDYQACETSDYETTQAAAFINRVREYIWAVVS